MRSTTGIIGACALLAGAASTAVGQIGDFVYDTTAGATTVYAGDLTAGTLALNSIEGRSFRVQIVGGDAMLGTYGDGVAPGASLAAIMTLDRFEDSGSPSGAGDIAYFIGTGGTDFVATDEFGETFSGSIKDFQLVDRSDSLIPGIEGQGRLRDLVFSGATFQGIPTGGNQNFGSLFTFSFLITGVNLETYLASDGLGNIPVEVETIEARVPGDAPLPSASGLALAGLAPLAVVCRRRRA
jgi:hypothetical protein